MVPNGACFALWLILCSFVFVVEQECAKLTGIDMVMKFRQHLFVELEACRVLFDQLKDTIQELVKYRARFALMESTFVQLVLHVFDSVGCC